MGGIMDGKEIYYSYTLRASNNRLSSTSLKRKAKSSYIPYDAWREAGAIVCDEALPVDAIITGQPLSPNGGSITYGSLEDVGCAV